MVFDLRHYRLPCNGSLTQVGHHCLGVQVGMAARNNIKPFNEFKNLSHAIAAVLAEKIVAVFFAQQLPQMSHYKIHLGLAKVELVLPNIPKLQLTIIVVVKVKLNMAKAGVIATEHAF